MQMIEYKGDKISHLSLGTVQLGIDYGVANSEGKPSLQKACEIISAVVDRGINCFDTATAYGDSEKVLGECLDKEAFIISKISSSAFDNIEDEVKASLYRLKQNRLFGLLLHDSDILDRWNPKSSQIVSNLKNLDLIKYFGVSIYSEDEFNKALEIDDIEFIQVPSNLLDNRLFRHKWQELANKRGKLLFIRSIYLQGLFFLGSNSIPSYLKEAIEPIEKLEEIAKSLNLTLPNLALAYIKSVANEAIILFGAESKDQAIENIELFERVDMLDSDTINKIIKISDGVDESIYNPSLWRRD